MSNALQYGDRGSDICIKLERDPHRGAEWAVIRVRDRGPGIRADELPRLFERFYRRPWAARRASESGVGLAGMQAIV